MKVLFVTATGGDVFHFIDHLQKLVSEARIIEPIRGDAHGKMEVYGVPASGLKGRHYRNYVVEQARRYDIIHVNGHPETVLRLCKSLPDKKIVFHIRGGEMRKHPALTNRAAQAADLVLYSTPDLKQYLDPRIRAHYVERAIDVDFFKPVEVKSARRLCIWKRRPLMTRRHFRKVRNIELVEYGSVKYRDLPAFFSQYGEYYDVRFDKRGGIIEATTKLALEALSMGLKVYDGHFRQIGPEFPQEHRPENVARKLAGLYGGLFP